MRGRGSGLIAATLVALTMLSACAAKPGSTSVTFDKNRPLEPQLDALVPGLLETHRVPGAAVAIVADGRTLVRGYGVRRAGTPEPIGPDTVFEAASLGKPLFAYSVAIRASKGELDLDHPLSTSVDKPFIADDPRVEKITARIVLSHTTGLPNWRPNRFSAQPGKLKFLRDPGIRFGYSGEGYMYLQRALERQSGKSLNALMQDSVLDPLGMTRTRYNWTRSFEPDFASPHDRKGEPGDKWRPRRSGVAYSLQSTAKDLSLFLDVMLAEENEIAESMLVPQIEYSEADGLAPSLGWSLGWGLERRPEGDWFWQWGDNGDFKHFVMGSRAQGRAVLVLTNGNKGANVYRAVVEAVLGFQPKALTIKYINY